MVKPEKFGHVHLVYQFTVTLKLHNSNLFQNLKIFRGLFGYFNSATFYTNCLKMY